MVGTNDAANIAAGANVQRRGADPAHDGRDRRRPGAVGRRRDAAHRGRLPQRVDAGVERRALPGRRRVPQRAACSTGTTSCSRSGSATTASTTRSRAAPSERRSPRRRWSTPSRAHRLTARCRYWRDGVQRDRAGGARRRRPHHGDAATGCATTPTRRSVTGSQPLQLPGRQRAAAVAASCTSARGDLDAAFDRLTDTAPVGRVHATSRRTRSCCARTSPPPDRSWPRTAARALDLLGFASQLVFNTFHNTRLRDWEHAGDIEFAIGCARAHNRGHGRVLLRRPAAAEHAVRAARRSRPGAGAGRRGDRDGRRGVADRLRLPARALAEPHRPRCRVGDRPGGGRADRVPRRRHRRSCSTRTTSATGCRSLPTSTAARRTSARSTTWRSPSSRRRRWRR